MHSSTDSLHRLIQVLLIYIINGTFQLHHSLLPQVDEEQASQKGEANALLMAWNKSHTDPCGHTNLPCHQTSSKQIKTRCRVIVPSISFVVIYAKHIESPMGGKSPGRIWTDLAGDSRRKWTVAVHVGNSLGPPQLLLLYASLKLEKENRDIFHYNLPMGIALTN